MTFSCGTIVIVSPPPLFEVGAGKREMFLTSLLEEEERDENGGTLHYFGGGTDIFMIKKYRFAKINYCENKVN